MPAVDRVMPVGAGTDAGRAAVRAAAIGDGPVDAIM
jgi:hypothetical protein